MAKNKVTLINRKEYERIRKMDHGQMSAYMDRIYGEGYEAGVASSPRLNEGEMRDILFSIKGIGGTKADAIVSAIFKAEEERRMG